MNRYVAIYVPSTLQGDKPAPVELRALVLHDVKVRLSHLFGGFTAYDAVGGWVSEEHGLIEENVTVVKAFIPDDTSHWEEPVNICARYVCRTLLQECVLVETENGIEFISEVAYA